MNGQVETTVMSSKIGHQQPANSAVEVSEQQNQPPLQEQQQQEPVDGTARSPLPQLKA